MLMTGNDDVEKEEGEGEANTVRKAIFERFPMSLDLFPSGADRIWKARLSLLGLSNPWRPARHCHHG